MVLGPAIGVTFTAFWMIYSFDLLGKAEDTDPQSLSSAISQAILSSVLGLVVGVVGFFILLRGLVMLVKLKKQGLQ